MSQNPHDHHAMMPKLGPEFFAALKCPANVTWTNDIQKLFTQPQIDCMQSVPRPIDLSSYDDVKANAQDILSAVSTGYMPKGGPRWTPDMVNTFGCWVQQGCPE
jgi:hypothetical protein